MEKETLQEFIDRTINESFEIQLAFSKIEKYIKLGVKWQQKISYSEQEVLSILDNYRNNFELYRNIQVLPNEFFNWFEQFKK